MQRKAVLFTISQIVGVAFCIGYGNEVRRYGCAVIPQELIADVVTNWAHLGLVSVRRQFEHGSTVRLQYTSVGCFWPRRLGQPPYTVDGILDTNTPHRHPFSRTG